MKYSLLILVVILCCANSAKILGLFPYPSKSHWILGNVLLKELASRGHEVTMVSPFPLKDPPERYEDVVLSGIYEKRDNSMSDILQANQTDIGVAIKTLRMIAKMSTDVTGHADLHAFLKQGRKYDLVIQVSIFMNEALLGVGHTLNASTIWLSIIGTTSFHNYLTGNPTPYAYVPHLATHFSDEMSFLQRLANTLSYIACDLLAYFIVLPNQQRLLSEFFPNAPPLEQLIDNVDLTLVNSHVATETPRPFLPNTIQIGGYHLQEKQQLPREIESFLNASTHGVVYFSLGSNAKSTLLPPTIQHEILEAFKSIKYNVLWVYHGTLTNKPKNLMTTTWAPQKAVLAHPNVKLFITHAGHGSTVESVYFGKPMICIPLFFDQHPNAADSVAKGYAITLKKDSITKKLLVDSINEIMDNPSYREKIELRADVYRNQEMNPMEKAVFWVEHVLKHKGAKHLKAKVAYLPAYKYYLLDVFAFITFVCLTTLLILYYFSRFVFRLCFCKPKKLKTN